MRFFNLRKKKNQRGAEMVEFAIVLPCFLMILMAIFYGAMWLHDVNALNEVTRAAVRYGVVEASGETTQDKYTNIKKYLDNEQTGADAALFIFEKTTKKIEIHGREDAEGATEEVKINDEPSVRVTLTAIKKTNLPIGVDEFIPETITSTLTMRLE